MADTEHIIETDWPAFGWVEDIRPALAWSLSAGRDVVLATLYGVLGSAPRGPGTQMLFDGERAVGYFSGGCVEADVARHAADVLRDGEQRHLHYGVGSPWVDVRLTCGGAIHIFLERIAHNSAAARELIALGAARKPALWMSDGRIQRVASGEGAPAIETSREPFTIKRRHDPHWRLIVSGGDPTAMAIAKLGAEAQFETYLVRAYGPSSRPPIDGITYLRSSPLEGLKKIGVDAWTAFVGATHESELDIPACATALAGGAGYVGLVGAASRVPDRTNAIIKAGAPPEAVERLHAPAGVAGLGKAPWRIAVSIIAEITQMLNQAQS